MLDNAIQGNSRDQFILCHHLPLHVIMSDRVSDRVGVQLLGELLLDRANGKVMLQYVGDPMNLKLMMILFKDQSRSIQFEAFHVFKVRCNAPPSIAWQVCSYQHVG